MRKITTVCGQILPYSYPCRDTGNIAHYHSKYAFSTHVEVTVFCGTSFRFAKVREIIATIPVQGHVVISCQTIVYLAS